MFQKLAAFLGLKQLDSLLEFGSYFEPRPKKPISKKRKVKPK